MHGRYQLGKRPHRLLQIAPVESRPGYRDGGCGLHTTKVLSAWGVIDALSLVLGGWLKLHVSPALANWTVALLVGFVLYGFALWFVWRSRIVRQAHHRELKASATQQAALQIELTTRKERDRRRVLIRDARDLAHQYNAHHRGSNFHAFIQKQRRYLDIEPYLSSNYREQIRQDSGRSIVVTGDGSSYGCRAFLDDVTRLEREWELA